MHPDMILLDPCIPVDPLALHSEASDVVDTLKMTEPSPFLGAVEVFLGLYPLHLIKYDHIMCPNLRRRMKHLC
jgi:hypothetical protein